jgi:hypothetical protein
MNRIAKVLSCEIHHGIIGMYLHRSLLWRITSNQGASKIQYEDFFIPSWSWMLYKGGINFIDDGYNWGDLRLVQGISFDEHAINTSVWKFRDSDIRVEPRDGHLDAHPLNSNGSKKGWISIDIEVELSKIPDLVVIAKLSKDQADGARYFVLFVEQQKSGEYERCGVGMIQEDCDLVPIGRQRII